MSSQSLPGGPLIPEPANGTQARSLGCPEYGVRPRYWLNVLLLIVTLLTTTAVGARIVENFQQNRPAFSVDDFGPAFYALAHPLALVSGLPFSLTLLLILLAHELGHYMACRYYGVSASLPYFLPGPPLIGTFGAFIRIHSPIYTKQVLFDVGIAGPLAGFIALLPALSIGLAYSKIVPGIAGQGDFPFGAPLLERLLKHLILPGVANSDIYVHPVARAAWVGMFSTALNLLPIGQLDGGHILYSVVGERHRWLSRAFALILIPMGFFYSPLWVAWGIAMLIIGLRHPAIFDHSPLDPGRKRLGIVALIIFVLCFMPTPIANPS